MPTSACSRYAICCSFPCATIQNSAIKTAPAMTSPMIFFLLILRLSSCASCSVAGDGASCRLLMVYLVFNEECAAYECAPRSIRGSRRAVAPDAFHALMREDAMSVIVTWVSQLWMNWSRSNSRQKSLELCPSSCCAVLLSPSCGGGASSWLNQARGLHTPIGWMRRSITQAHTLIDHDSSYPYRI